MTRYLKTENLFWGQIIQVIQKSSDKLQECCTKKVERNIEVTKKHYVMNVLPEGEKNIGIRQQGDFKSKQRNCFSFSKTSKK